ncbi:hypothetical protein [Microbacterium sp. K24]|nr:hypothetical protein [Microbacterium sp. K24]
MRIDGCRRARELYRLVLDIIYIALTLALFALVSLVAKGVERL